MKIRLAHVLIALAVLLVSAAAVHGQSREQPTWLIGYFGHQEYDGDLGNEFLEFNVGNDWAGGLGISQYIHRYLDLDLSLIYGKLDYKNFNIPDDPGRSRYRFSRSFLNINTFLRFRILRNPNVIQPFLATGFGITPTWGGQSARIFFNPRELREFPTRERIVFQVPVQIGTDVRISDNVALTANATYNRTFSEGIDARGDEFDVDGRNHDDFIVYSIGFKIGLNKTRDSDGDGIKDKNDLCPNKFGRSFWGCPDGDGDGIVDNEDACPAEAGSSALSGCPDTDGDGIANRRDKCPEEAGSFENSGCPKESDSDGDGIADNLDACPEEKGLAENVKQDLQNIFESLQFTVNSSNIDPSSFDELDRLAQIMQDDPELRLIIRGHTDNTGNPNDNLELSVDRANAVKQYLVDQGVEAGRIAAFGYGETRPVASNDTREGREQNRRVELDLYYQ